MLEKTLDGLMLEADDRINSSSCTENVKLTLKVFLAKINSEFERNCKQKALVLLGIFYTLATRENLYTKDEVNALVQKNFAADESPATIPVTLVLRFKCAHCTNPVFVVQRESSCLLGANISSYGFPDFDPERRLNRIQDIGINVDFRIDESIWDPVIKANIIFLGPVSLNPQLSEESVSLAVSLLKEHGWTDPVVHMSEGEAPWTQVWAKHEKPNPVHCPCTGHMPHDFVSSFISAVGQVKAQTPIATKVPKKKKKPDGNQDFTNN